MTEHGLYKIDDTYFTDYPSPYWIDNKGEGRPYYYAFKDADGLFWMIPISSQVENYEIKIAREEERRGVGNCIYYHIGKIAGEERVFIISDVFPVSDKYVKSEYTIAGIHYIVKNSKLISGINTKLKRFMKLIQDGHLKSRSDIMGIKSKLLNGKQ